jgi:phosphatidylserine decarboxylase
MEVRKTIVLPVTITLAFVVTCALCYLFWRYVWFFRNPNRTIPPDGSGILSPADGTVVYARQMKPQESVINIKRGIEATLDDITREDMIHPKILIGIFMSPFNVHYNRVPVSGTIRFIHHHPASTGNVCMLWMHLRTLFRRPPLYKNSTHIVLNERTVTKIDGEYRGNRIGCYVVQIAAKSVSGIDVYASEGQKVSAGEIYGMIRIGSQVDMVVTPLAGMKIRVTPGQRVRAGRTVLID